MKKYLSRIALGAGTLGVIIAGAAAFSAYEAHIINVTAKIENALSVSPESIAFGTVFPQEVLHRNLEVNLSQSFKDEGRVDDVEYKIVQKLKPTPEGYNGPFETLGEGEGEGTGRYYPSLCAYLSKHKVDVDQGQEEASVSAFHKDRTWTGEHVMYIAAATGRLAKSQNDVTDEWDIDLAVPVFDGTVGQDWADFVKRESGDSQINPNDYVLPAGLEHATFGCDLWVEVTGVSTNYVDQVDLGNSASETAHNAQGWWPYPGQGNYGGRDGGQTIAIVRNGGEVNECSVPTALASFTLDKGTQGQYLVLRHLDGQSNLDSFDVKVNGVLVGHYTDSTISSEDWVTSYVALPGGLPSILQVEIVNTDGPWSGCPSWGQLALNWAKTSATAEGGDITD